jgi:solute carrier family 35 protein E1
VAPRPALRLRGGFKPSSLAVAQRAPASGHSELTAATPMFMGIDYALLFYFAGWYLGNYYYTLNNKYALKAAGGATGFPVTIGFLQMLIGSLYALYLWIAPDARAFPAITMSDLLKIAPVATCAAGGHISSIFSMNLGAVSFAQIVKAAEPAFAALIGVTLYGKPISKAKWLCLIPVIGGVCLASIKELDFSVAALFAACLANVFAAFRSNENKKLMETPGLKERIGSVGNQFAISTILGTLVLFPLFLILEASRFGKFVEIFKESAVLRNNLITSGLYFYLYNELSTMTISKTSATTQSVANTAKRVIVIVGVALALGESLEPIKLLGCSIGIGGVLLYSLVK